MLNEAPDVDHGDTLYMTLCGQRRIIKWSTAIYSENTHTEASSACIPLPFLFNTAEFQPVW